MYYRTGLLPFFVLDNILGSGIYARVGRVAREVASEVGGTIWVPFLVSFLIAALTAVSYGELITKYPGASGAALFVNRPMKFRSSPS